MGGQTEEGLPKQLSRRELIAGALGIRGIKSFPKSLGAQERQQQEPSTEEFERKLNELINELIEDAVGLAESLKIVLDFQYEEAVKLYGKLMKEANKPANSNFVYLTRDEIHLNFIQVIERRQEIVRTSSVIRGQQTRLEKTIGLNQLSEAMGRTINTAKDKVVNISLDADKKVLDLIAKIPELETFYMVTRKTT